jgi:hypothetical protein
MCIHQPIESSPLQGHQRPSVVSGRQLPLQKMISEYRPSLTAQRPGSWVSTPRPIGYILLHPWLQEDSGSLNPSSASPDTVSSMATAPGRLCRCQEDMPRGPGSFKDQEPRCWESSQDRSFQLWKSGAPLHYSTGSWLHPPWLTRWATAGVLSFL